MLSPFLKDIALTEIYAIRGMLNFYNVTKCSFKSNRKLPFLTEGLVSFLRQGLGLMFLPL